MEDLMEQIKEKDKQIKEKDKQIKEKDKQIKEQIKEKDKQIKEKEKEMKEQLKEKLHEKDKEIEQLVQDNDNTQQLLHTITQKLLCINSILTEDQKIEIDKIEIENKIEIDKIEIDDKINDKIKRNIPKTVRDKLWRNNFNENPNGKCYVCNETVTYGNFHAGHIISIKGGGDNNINNLRVTCQLCNTSMGSQNLEEFKKEYFNNEEH
jgi:5-methylcytosine-specific restriction endonuclease McrA